MFPFIFYTDQLDKLNINHCLLFSVIIREKSKLREDIVAHRQKKLVMRRARQKYLEEAALREAELLQELDKFVLCNWFCIFMKWMGNILRTD